MREVVTADMWPQRTTGGAILMEAALGYLGLGTAEPTPSRGLMLSGLAPSYAEKALWTAALPGLASSLAVVDFNLWGDLLRDALDPKVRRECAWWATQRD